LVAVAAEAAEQILNSAILVQQADLVVVVAVVGSDATPVSVHQTAIVV
jgi:hypothetical protein